MTYLDDYIRPVLEDRQFDISNDNRRCLHLTTEVKRAIAEVVELQVQRVVEQQPGGSLKEQEYWRKGAYLLADRIIKEFGINAQQGRNGGR